jgi:uncharacterized membrane protein YdfJ with MMPL/SSD domain
MQERLLVGRGGAGARGAEAMLENATERRFFRLGQCIARCRWGVVLLFAGLTVPMAVTAARLGYSISLGQMTPRASPSTLAMDYLEEVFGAGTAFPYTLVIKPPEGQTIMSQSFFEEANVVVSKL